MDIDSTASRRSREPRPLPWAWRSASEISRGAAAEDSPSSLEGYGAWAARKLVLMGHHLFMETMEIRENHLLKGVSEEQVVYDLITSSAKHRQVLFRCLGEKGGPPPQGENSLAEEDAFHDGVTDFYHVWTLAEIFLLVRPILPSASLLPWLDVYRQSREDEVTSVMHQEVEDALYDGKPGERHPRYWEVVKALVLTGRTERAAAMLRRHSQGGPGGEADRLARLVESYPHLIPEDARSESGVFQRNWTRWRRSTIEAARRSKDEHIRELWDVISGDRRALEGNTNTWFELLMAELLYSQPGLEPEDLPGLLAACSRKYPAHSSEEFLLEIMVEAVSEGASKVVDFCRGHGSTSLAFTSCAAHLIDLLVEARSPGATPQARLWMFTRLAERLEVVPCGWELAATYLSSPPLRVGARPGRGARWAATGRGRGQGGWGDGAEDEEEDGEEEEGGQGRALLRLMAGRVCPGSERSTHEFVGWCRAWGLKKEADTACCARGLACLREGSAGKAAYWLWQAGNSARLERLCADVSERLVRTAGLEAICAGFAGRDVGSLASPSRVAGKEAREAARADADGVLLAIPKEAGGDERNFLQGYSKLTDELERCRRVFVEAETHSSMDKDSGEGEGGGGEASDEADAARSEGASFVVSMLVGDGHVPPTRAWPHLFRLALPLLKEGDIPLILDVRQTHVLLGRLQTLLQSNRRVGWFGPWESDVERARGSSQGPLQLREEDEEELCRALADRLAWALKNENAEVPSSKGGMAARSSGGGGRGGGGLGAVPQGRITSGLLPAEALVGPRVTIPGGQMASVPASGGWLVGIGRVRPEN